MESPKRFSNPSDVLWNLFGKPLDIDAVKLVEESWKDTLISKPKKLRCEKQKEAQKF
ncbi:MAG: hypothetical protein ABSC20_03940 [Candidatus Bathyarchaeia archaeon]|jgi:hypothetical protein